MEELVPMIDDAICCLVYSYFYQTFLSTAYILIHLPAQVYRQLMSNKPELERLLVMVQDGAGNSEGEESTISPVNRLVTKE